MTRRPGWRRSPARQGGGVESGVERLGAHAGQQRVRGHVTGGQHDDPTELAVVVEHQPGPVVEIEHHPGRRRVEGRAAVLRRGSRRSWPVMRRWTRTVSPSWRSMPSTLPAPPGPDHRPPHQAPGSVPRAVRLLGQRDSTAPPTGRAAPRRAGAGSSRPRGARARAPVAPTEVPLRSGRSGTGRCDPSADRSRRLRPRRAVGVGASRDARPGPRPPARRSARRHRSGPAG